MSLRGQREIHGDGVTISSKESVLKGVKGGTRGWDHHLVGGVSTKLSRRRVHGWVTIWSEECDLGESRDGKITILSEECTPRGTRVVY